MLVNTPHDLSLQVREQRKKLKLTQADVSKRVGLQQDTISDFENRSEGTKLDTLFRILSATGLELHIVPKGEGGEAPEETWNEPW